jgi:hypothetical protein
MSEEKLINREFKKLEDGRIEIIDKTILTEKQYNETKAKFVRDKLQTISERDFYKRILESLNKVDEPVKILFMEILTKIGGKIPSEDLIEHYDITIDLLQEQIEGMEEFKK